MTRWRRRFCALRVRRRRLRYVRAVQQQQQRWPLHIRRYQHRRLMLLSR